MSGIMFRSKLSFLSSEESGAVGGLAISFVLVLLLLIGAVGFGVWAFMGRQDYKNNTDQKIAAAVVVAQKQQAAADNAKYNELEKQPLLSYVGPSDYGSVKVEYPKTWSVYSAVASQAGSQTPLNAYFQPGAVPDVNNQTNNYALRISIVSTPYNQVLQGFTSQVQSQQISSSPYSLPKVPSVVGVKLTGSIEQNKQGEMIILPLRDTTLQIWTDTQSEVSDLNTYILPNLSFSP